MTTKQSRKDLLKREDAFILAAEEGAAWASKYRMPLMAVAAALVVVALGAWGFGAYGEKRDREASQMFSEGWKIVEEGVVKDPAQAEEGAAADPNHKPKSAKADRKKGKRGQDEGSEPDANAPTFASEKEQWAAARQKFQEVVDRAGMKGVGAMAAFMVGDLDEKLGEAEASEKLFADLQKALSPKDHLYFLAAERVAYRHEARGDNDGAIEALRELAADDKYFYADYAQFHQARLYLAKSDTDKARSLLDHIDKAFPHSSLIDDVRTKLAELGDGGVAALGQPAGVDANDKAHP